MSEQYNLPESTTEPVPDAYCSEQDYLDGMRGRLRGLESNKPYIFMFKLKGDPHEAISLQVDEVYVQGDAVFLIFYDDQGQYPIINKGKFVEGFWQPDQADPFIIQNDNMQYETVVDAYCMGEHEDDLKVATYGAGVLLASNFELVA